MNKLTLIALVFGAASATRLSTPFMTDEQYAAKQAHLAQNKEFSDNIDEDHLVQLSDPETEPHTTPQESYCKYTRSVDDKVCVPHPNNVAGCIPPDNFPTNKQCTINALAQKKGMDTVYCVYERNDKKTCVKKAEPAECVEPEERPTNADCTE